MSYCGKCGNQITDESVGCTLCNPSAPKEENNQPVNNKKPLISRLVSALFPIIAFVICLSIFTGGNIPFTSSGKKAAIESAETKAKQWVYKEKGLVAERFDSEVIYADGDKRLIVVRMAFDLPDDYPAENPYGYLFSYCMYTDAKYVVNGTTIQDGDYDFESRIEELKALFGL